MRDLSHQQCVSDIGFQHAYRIIPQCVADSGDVSSNDRERLTNQSRDASSEAPTMAHPSKGGAAKPEGLQRVVQRHARPAAERSSGRGI
jgi:hypothetical protein